METQGGNPVGYAFGRVSLWGRVIEHESGWRAQYAYPYALTLETLDEDAALVIRREYAVDVEWAGAELFTGALERRRKSDERERAKKEKAESDFQREMAAIDKRLGKLQERLRSPRETAKPAQKVSRVKEERERQLAALPALPTVDDVTEVDLLRAILTVAVSSYSQLPSEVPQPGVFSFSREPEPPTARPLVDTSDVTDAVVLSRGAQGSISYHHNHWASFNQRTGFDEWLRAVRSAMKRLREAGLVDWGQPYRHSAEKLWRMTPEGLSALKAAGVPKTVTLYDSPRDDPFTFTPVAVQTEDALAYFSLPAKLFVRECDALMQQWEEERRRAQTLTPVGYARWVKKRRASHHTEALTVVSDV